LKTILIGEDNPVNKELLAAILEHWGYAVREASNGEEVLAGIEASVPDLVLLDIQMPELDGYAVLRRLRADSRFEHLKIVALTAYAMRGDRERALEAGFDGYVVKPVDRKVLRDEIERLIAPAQA
jgi:CheY-like chemotaxis protein